MRSPRQRFTPEYNDEAVKLVINTGRTVAKVPRKIGLPEQTPGRWTKAHRAREVGARETAEEYEQNCNARGIYT
jgi:transposase